MLNIAILLKSVFILCEKSSRDREILTTDSESAPSNYPETPIAIQTAENFLKNVHQCYLTGVWILFSLQHPMFF